MTNYGRALVGVVLCACSFALAEVPTITIPQEVKTPLFVDVMVQPEGVPGPSFRLRFERPTHALCFKLATRSLRTCARSTACASNCETTSRA